jgi:dihydrofolate reductase
MVKHADEEIVMGKIVSVLYVSLNGAFEDLSWTGPYFNEELQSWQYDNLMEADVMLLGRKTYEGFKEAWPKMEAETGDFGQKMNSMPKRVATTTLTEPEWNATFIEGDVADAVRELKAGPDSVLMGGSGALVNYLTKHRLIDEYRIMVYPLVVGKGRNVWDDDTEVALELTKSFITKSGVAVLTYVPA